MNIKERDRIMILVRNLIERYTTEKDILEKCLEDQRDLEEQKLENMPDSLSESEIIQGIEDAMETIEEAIDVLSSATEQIESIPEIMNLKMKKSRTKETEEKFVIPENEEKLPKDSRLLIALPRTLLGEIKRIAKKTGLSTNEIANRYINQGIENSRGKNLFIVKGKLCSQPSRSYLQVCACK